MSAAKDADLHTPDPADRSLDRASATMGMESWESRVELRIAKLTENIRAMRRQVDDLAHDVRSHHEAAQINHAAVIGALEGRTRLAEKTLEAVRQCAEGIGSMLRTILDRFTQPTATFVVMWVLTLVAIGGITVSEVMDLGTYVSTWTAQAPGPGGLTDGPPPEPASEP